MDIYIAPIHVNMLLCAEQLKENILKFIFLFFFLKCFLLKELFEIGPSAVPQEVRNKT